MMKNAWDTLVPDKQYLAELDHSQALKRNAAKAGLKTWLFE
jgi:hypothetical protein